MNLWRRVVGDRPIVTRLVLAVAGAMTAVLLVAGAFVFWRFEYALDRQLDQDLRAYQEIVQREIRTGTTPPGDTPGESYQVYAADGAVTGGTAAERLVDSGTVRRAMDGQEQHQDVGRLFPPTEDPYRVVAARVQTPAGPLVVASAISKANHDEALRELLLQLAIADLATLAAAAFVGYRTARAALNPVERYRAAAERAGTQPAPHLPISDNRDDEVTRLVRTFNRLLHRIGEAAERERQFLADASHELRSPLALMRAELEWTLLRPRSPQDTKKALESLQGQVERLIDLSDELLDLEELRADTIRAREPIDVTALIEDVAGRFDKRAAEQDRTIERLISPDLQICGSRRWLEVALSNLVSNALLHGKGTVRIAAKPTRRGTRLSVDDDGPGFPADFIDSAFQRFTRADPSRSTPGTGLGLALVQAVAEAHGGSAEISGAKVSVVVPEVTVTL